MGEKEWYFYCPRDRKYRNSTRPNRVTGAGFWKATGTDRPIYSSDASKCIGLKKSLVFYRGRAAKGIKTDWMMHEFRLPSPSDHHSAAASNATYKKHHHSSKDLPCSDAWAICRIFKKTTNSISSHRALQQSWICPTMPETANHHSSQTTTLLATSSSSDILSQIAQEHSVITSSGFPTLPLPSSSAAASVFASHMLGVPYNLARNNVNAAVETTFMENNNNNNNEQINYFNMAIMPHESKNVRPVGFGFPVPEMWPENAQCASEMSATSYSTNN